MICTEQVLVNYSIILTQITDLPMKLVEANWEISTLFSKYWFYSVWNKVIMKLQLKRHFDKIMRMNLCMLESTQ